MTDDELMVLALGGARSAESIGEVPIGAVVQFGNYVVAAHNSPISRHDPTAHAEVLALRTMARLIGNYRMPGARLVVTVEPCLMCVGAAIQARISEIVIGCDEPKTGALGSRMPLETAHALGLRCDVRRGIQEAESRALLQGFFQARRGVRARLKEHDSKSCDP